MHYLAQKILSMYYNRACRCKHLPLCKNIWHWHVSNSLLSISIIGALSVSSARLPFLESPRTMGYLSMGTQHVQEIGYGCHSDMQVVHQKVLLSIRKHYTTKEQDED